MMSCKWLDWIKNWRIKPKKKKSVNPWGIVIPHTSMAQGAQTPKGLSEYKYALSMMDYIGLPFETRNEGGVSGATRALIKQGTYKSIEPHLNAFNGVAHGFEILVMLGDKESFNEATRIAKAFKVAFPDRTIRHGNGIKLVGPGDRGYGSIHIAKREGMQIALLSEAFFIDNSDEWISPRVMGEFWKLILN